LDLLKNNKNNMNEKEIIKKYFSELAKKSHIVVKAKYGKEHYSKMARIRWEKEKVDVTLE